LNNHKNRLKDQSKENRNPKNINNTLGKLLLINSLNSDIIGYNNYLTNNEYGNKKIKNDDDINISENCVDLKNKMDGSYTRITFNNYNNQLINNNKTTSIEKKPNITVNKIGINSNNIYTSINTNGNASIIKDKNGNIKRKRDFSAKGRQDYFNFNKKYYLKDNNNQNSSGLKKIKNYSPTFETNERKNSVKINNNNNINNNLNNNINNKLNYYSQNIQKTKNKISNINTISLNSNNISNFCTNNSSTNNHNYSQTQTNPKEEKLFEHSDDKSLELTKDEKIIYGDRIMSGYTKKKLLGKGGCGIVWCCEKNKKEKEEEINEEFAVKQTSKKNGKALINMANENILTAKNEIKILNKLNEIKNEFIPQIFDVYEDNNDLWFSFEKGGIALSGLSFKIKGEFEKGERIYHIQKGIFLMSLFSNISQFKFLLKSLLLCINDINKTGIIHSDIKPENILIEYDGSSLENNFRIKSIKIIDYGSAFFINNTSLITSNTPEYLCPEITIGNKKFLKDLKNNNLKYINCIDIWSLGITFLELCLCCPTWMSYKTKVIINGKIYHSSGLFGCRGRDASKIYQKQIELSKNINKKLKNSMLYLFDSIDRNNFVDLLKKMLEFDYRKRINCQDALNHPFFKE
jgi:serine/threonine protein kinase